MAHEARRIAAQHQYLDALERTTRSALERGAAGEVTQALLGFAGSLEAHFSLEEQVQFPALHGLDPHFDTEIAELERDHVRFRAELAAMQALAAGSELLAAFDELAGALGLHEAREEAMLARAFARG